MDTNDLVDFDKLGTNNSNSNNYSKDYSKEDFFNDSMQCEIDRVGMENIVMPVKMSGIGEEIFFMPAKINAYVSLDRPEVKGIHMSRLFLILQDILSKKKITYSLLKKILESFIKSHDRISSSAYIKISLDYLIKRASLKSNNSGWKSYPVFLEGQLKDKQFKLFISCKIYYASTCPCSTSLSQAVIYEDFMQFFSQKSYKNEENFKKEDFYKWLQSNGNLSALPHSQRSYVKVKLMFDDFLKAPSLLEIIDNIEQCLGTPVQAVVKREDEKEFARLNSKNLMFCEDAARKINDVLDKKMNIDHYKIKTCHIESLHAHNAVSIIEKNNRGK